MDGSVRAPSAYETAFAKGADGEAVVGARLNEAARAAGGIATLHDLVAPGEKANIDHLVIGPRGIIVIDAKAWSGRVWIGRKTLGQGRYGRTAAIDGVLRQVARVERVLAAAGRADVSVTGLICLVNGHRGPDEGRIVWRGGVGIGSRDAVVRHVIGTGPISFEDVHRLQALLSQRFRVQGGAVAPTRPRDGHARVPGATVGIPATPRPARRRPTIRGTRASHLARMALSVVLALALALLLLGAGIALLTTGVKEATSQIPPMSGHELRGRSAMLRALAVGRARGRVRGPRVRTTAGSFVLTYRRGKRCRVTVTVPRAIGSRSRPPEVQAERCRRLL